MTERDVRHADVDDVRGPLWEEAVAATAARGGVVPAAGGEGRAADDADADDGGNLRRYARWQWRDFWRRRGGWLALGAVLGVALLAALVHYSYADAAAMSLPAEAADRRAQGITAILLPFGAVAAALIGVGGLVSRERERGLQRFLFAKPVRPLRYYLQAFAINSAGALLVFAGAVLLATLVLGGAAVPVGSVLAMGLAAYVVTAGVTFLLSTLVRFDAAITAAWLLAGFPVYAIGHDARVPGVRAVARVLVWLFPQGPGAALAGWAERFDTAGRAAGVMSVGAYVVIAFLVAYGLLAAAGGVAVLRRRAIST